MKNELQDLLDTQLSDLRWSQAKSEDIIRKTRGEVKVKKKLSLSLVIVMVLILLTATAFAIYAIQRSPQADAILEARRALTEKYGLSAEAFGLFHATATQEGENWVVTFTSNDSGIPDLLLGEYTVTLNDGKMATAVWTHDDMDPSLWQSGDVHAEAWGQPQIEKALRGDEEATAVRMTAWEKQEAHVTSNPKPETPATKEGEYYYNGELAKVVAPPSDAITQEKALEIAKQAVMEEYGVPRETLKKADVVSCEYIVTQSGKGVWDSHIYFVYQEVEWGCGVSMEGKTGEILSIGSVTGGNG